MHIARRKNLLVITLELLEIELLLRTFHVITQEYRIKPADQDAKLAEVWYSTRGCKSAGMSPEETRDWLELLHGYKSANLALLEDWIRQLTELPSGKPELRIRLEHAPNLLTICNDHRLLLAARHNIAESEMDLRRRGELGQLPVAKQTAVYQIHLLGWVIEELLSIVAPDAAGWMDI
jgi:hypothetical protein